MKNLVLFDKKYNIILNPFSFENIWQLQSYFKDCNRVIKFKELKSLTLCTFKYLLDKKIIYVLEPNWMENNNFMKINMSVDEIMNFINDRWKIGTTDDELYNLLWFKYQDWYTVKLKELGLTVGKTNWDEFIKDRIGNFELWIDENRPN